MPGPNVGTAYVDIRSNVAGLGRDIRQKLVADMRGAGDEAGDAFGQRFEQRMQRLQGRLESASRRLGQQSGRRFADGFGESSDSRIVQTIQRLTARAIPASRDQGRRSGRAFGDGFGRGLSLDLGPFNLRFASFGQLIARLAPIAVAVGDTLIGLSAQAISLSSALFSAASASALLLPLVTSLIGGALAGVIAFQGFGEAVKGDAAALRGLTPSAREAAVAARGITSAWGQLQDTVQENFFRSIGDSIDRVANRLLPNLQTGLAQSATTLGRFVQDFTRWATSAENLADLNTVMNSQNTILSRLLGSVRPLTAAFRDWLIPMLPFAERLADAIRNGAERLAEFAEQGRQSGATAEFFERAYENASNLLAGIRDLTVGIVNFFSAGQAGGAGMLEKFAELSARFRDFAASVEGQEAFRDFFEFGQVVGDRLLSALRTLGGLLIPIAVGISDVLAALAPLLPAIEDIAGSIGGALGGALSELGSLLGGLTAGVGPVVSLLAEFVDIVLDGFGALPGPIRAVAGAFLAFKVLGLGTLFASAADGIRGLGTSLRGLPGAISPVTLGLTAVTLAAGLLKDAMTESQAASRSWARDFVASSGADVEQQIEAVTEKIDSLEESQRALASSGGVTQFAQEAALGLFGVNVGASDLQQRINELGVELEGLRGQQEANSEADLAQIRSLEGVSEAQVRAAAAAGISAEAFERSFATSKESIEGLATSLDQFGDPLGAFTAASEEAAQAAADATSDAGDSWEDFVDGVEVDLGRYNELLAQQIQDQADWAGNLASLAGRVPEEVFSHLSRLGPEGAPLIAALVNASDEEFAKLVENIGLTLPGATAKLSEELALWEQIARETGINTGEGLSAELTAAIGRGEIGAVEAARRLGIAVEETIPGQITIDTTLYTQEFVNSADFVAERAAAISAIQAQPEVQLIDLPFLNTLAVVNGQITTLDAQRPEPTVLLDNVPFLGTLGIVNGEIVQLDAERPEPTVLLNNVPFLGAVGIVDGRLATLDRQRPTPTAGLNATSLFASVVGATQAILGIPDKTAEVDIQTNGVGVLEYARGLIESLRDRIINIHTNYTQTGSRGVVDRVAADGGIFNQPTTTLLGEAGSEVVIPLTRPARAIQLAQESGLLDLLNGRASSGSSSTITATRPGSRSIVVQPGAIQVVTPARDPAGVAQAVLDRLVIATQ